MIEISLLQMAHPEFNQVVQAIWNSPTLSAKASYSAHRIRERIIKENKEIQNLRISLCEKYGKKGEDGKLVVDEKGFVAFETPEDQQTFEKTFQEIFSSKIVKFKVSKLNFDDIAQVKGISPAQWSFLEPLVENFPVAEETEESDPVAVAEPLSPPKP